IRAILPTRTLTNSKRSIVISVSTPSSSGQYLQPGVPQPAHCALSAFQSLLHQGNTSNEAIIHIVRNASTIEIQSLLHQVNTSNGSAESSLPSFPERVSIPSSSGQYFQRLRPMAR